MLEENPNKKLQILGHNNAAEDEVGAEKSVYADMDNNRIGVVMKYLMEKGISESRMVPTRKGSKETQEHGEMDDDETKQAKNRRVTFVLL